MNKLPYLSPLHLGKAKESHGQCLALNANGLSKCLFIVLFFMYFVELRISGDET